MGLIKKEFIREKKEPYIMEASFKKETNDFSAAGGQTHSGQPKTMQILTETAEDIRSQAFEEVKKIKEEAQQKAGEALEAARKEGLESGKQEGWQQVGDYIREALETLNQAIIEKNKIIKSSEPEIIKLAIKIAEQIIRSEVSLNRDVCLSIVSEAIGKITDREQVIIRVNQANLEQVRSQRDRLASLIDGVKNLSIQEDSQIEPGGCIVETNLGYVDAKISSKLIAIEEALKRVLDTGEEDQDKEKEKEEASEPGPENF